MSEQTYTLIKMILEVLVYAVVIYLIPTVKKAIQSWAEANVSKDQKEAALDAVKFAYQTLAKDDMDGKKVAAVEYFTSIVKAKGWNITDEQINGLIEAVYQTFKANGNK